MIGTRSLTPPADRPRQLPALGLHGIGQSRRARQHRRSLPIRPVVEQVATAAVDEIVEANFVDPVERVVDG